jgi:uncharacterized integral membrane protein
MNWRLLVVLAMLVLLVIFVIQNYVVVEINFLFWSFKISRALIIFVALAIGFISGWVISLISRGRQ